MEKLEKVADGFDKIHAEAQADVEDFFLVKGGQWAGETFGADSIGTYTTAIGASIAYSLTTFTLASGKGLVDILRLGKGVRSGTVSGIGHDALRVLNILPVAGMIAKGVGLGARAASIAMAARVVGGSYVSSCGATASAAAARLSGTRVFMTLEEIGKMTGLGNPKLNQFPGMWYSQLKNLLTSISTTTKEIDMTGAGIDVVGKAAAQGQGPVVFGVQWWQGFTPLRNALYNTIEADHWLVAFQNIKGEVMVADQFGMRPIAQLGTINGTTTSFTISSKALIVGEGGIMTAVTKLQNAGLILKTGKVADWLATSFGLEMIIVDSKTTQSLDAQIRQILGRPPREWSSMLTKNKTLSPTLEVDSQLVLMKLPFNRDSREFTQLATETGLSNERLLDALFLLNRKNLITITELDMKAGKVTPASVQRKIW
jgi:hypothetical protein